MSTATKSELNELHALVATVLSSDLNSKDPEIRQKALGQAIKFLKDNHIEAIPEAGTPLSDLEENVTKLPFVQSA